MADSTPTPPATDPPGESGLPIPAASALWSAPALGAQLLSDSYTEQSQALPPQQYEVVHSADGRVKLTNDKLEINGQGFGWWELEAVDVQRVKWLLWLLLGGFILAGFLLGFLQNWLRTMPAALGMVVGVLLLALGQRGTNRLRLHRLGREALHFALPGELAPWQKLTAEMNRRIIQRHHEAAESAAALIAAARAAHPALTDPPVSPTANQ